MKKVTAFLFSMITLIGCSQLSDYHHQLERAEEVIEDNPDSAWVLLGEISASSISDGEERAWYNLLLTEVSYKQYKSFENDSLISTCVDYYTMTNNKERLATALYYKSAVLNTLGEFEKATQSLKMAEELAVKTEDILLQSKIYELLWSINYKSKNYHLSKQYANFFIEVAKIINQPKLLALAYNCSMSTYKSLGYLDKAKTQEDLAMKYAKQCEDDKYLVYFYTNYANMQIADGNYQEAKTWIGKAIALKPVALQYIMLGRICYQEGDTLQARLNWEKAAAMGEPIYSINAYKYLAQLYNERRNYFKVAQMLAKADSVQIFYNEELRTTQLAEIQQRYDRAVTEKSLVNQKNMSLRLFIFTLIILIVALLAINYYQWRMRKYKSAISTYVLQINAGKQRLAELETSGKDAEKEISLLKANIDRIQQISADKIGRGKALYEQITNGNIPRLFTKTMEQDFTDYYAFTFYERYTELVRPYHSLSLRNTCFLILQEMELNDKDIAQLMSISTSTVRNYRHRLRKNSIDWGFQPISLFAR